MGIFSGGKRPERNGSAIDKYSGRIFFNGTIFVKSNTLEAGNIVFMGASISHVLGMGSFSEIYPAIIAFIAVYMIDVIYGVNPRHKLKNKSVRQIQSVGESYHQVSVISSARYNGPGM